MMVLSFFSFYAKWNDGTTADGTTTDDGTTATADGTTAAGCGACNYGTTVENWRFNGWAVWRYE